MLKSLMSYDKAIVFIGSSQESRTKRNPLTFEERVLLFSETLSPDLIKKLTVHPLPDCSTNEEWIAQILSKLSKEDLDQKSVTFIGNDKDTDTTAMNQFVREYFPFEVFENKQEMCLDATTIRKQLAEGIDPTTIEGLHPTTSLLIKELFLDVFIKAS